ncbi:MAG: hypothetical protein PHD33_05505 [Atribacterota bacterium]|nr:hypothetical protein [Atribacterota bacterium]
MENKNDLFKQKVINEIDGLIEKTERVRSELFNIYQMEYALFTGIAFGVLGGILGNFVYNIFDKNSIAYWMFFVLMLIIVGLLAKKTYHKIKHLNKLYIENDDMFEKLNKNKSEISKQKQF